MIKLPLLPTQEGESAHIILTTKWNHAYNAKALDTEYLLQKLEAFRFKTVNPEDIKLKNKEVHGINAVYTRAAEIKNLMAYEEMIRRVTCNNHRSNDCVINFADTFADYIDMRKDTSELNIIHYMKNRVTLFFHSIDSEELIYTLIALDAYFIQPVYCETRPTINVVVSSLRNVKDLQSNLEKLIHVK